MANGADRCHVESDEFGVEKADVERRVMDDQLGAVDELEELVGHFGEARLVLQEIEADAAKYGDRRRSELKPAEKATLTQTVADEPVTLNAEAGAGFVAFSPLAQGLLTDRYLNGIPEGSRMAAEGSLRRDVLPGAQLAYENATKGFDLGKFSFLDVLDAQRTLFQARNQYLRALTDTHRAAAEIDRLLADRISE